MNTKKYKKPIHVRIARDTDAEEALYKAEDRLHDSVRVAALAWGRVVKDMQFARNSEPIISAAEAEDFWRVLLPQCLFDLLNGYDKQAAVMAARTFLAQFPIDDDQTRGDKQDLKLNLVETK